MSDGDDFLERMAAEWMRGRSESLLLHGGMFTLTRWTVTATPGPYPPPSGLWLWELETTGTGRPASKIRGGHALIWNPHPDPKVGEVFFQPNPVVNVEGLPTGQKVLSGTPALSSGELGELAQLALWVEGVMRSEARA